MRVLNHNLKLVIMYTSCYWRTDCIAVVTMNITLFSIVNVNICLTKLTCWRGHQGKSFKSFALTTCVAENIHRIRQDITHSCYFGVTGYTAFWHFALYSFYIMMHNPSLFLPIVYILVKRLYCYITVFRILDIIKKDIIINFMQQAQVE